MIYKTVLENGMRVVAERMSSVKSLSVGLWVNVGSRDEDPEEHGTSHFLEHMFFKGTATRSALDIAREIDQIGGELNAFTSRETTTFYAKVLDTHVQKAIDLLSDNFHHSSFDPREIAKEKQVVIEEIKMVEDDPEDLVQERYAGRVWNGNPLGRPILGTVETISGLTRGKILNFLKRTYDPKEIVISVAGRFDVPSMMAALSTAFGRYTGDKIDRRPRRPPPRAVPVFEVEKRNLEQVHLCIGADGLSHNHPDRFVLLLMNTILGGSVSSRLFQEVRERRGLVYSIYSSISSYEDGGLFTVYAGTGHENAPKVVDLILKEIRKMKRAGVSPLELENAKNHIKGSILLGMESTSSRMSRIAKDELYFGRHIPLQTTLREIDKVSGNQISRLTETLFGSRALSLTALGKIDRNRLPKALSV